MSIFIHATNDLQKRARGFFKHFHYHAILNIGFVTVFHTIFLSYSNEFTLRTTEGSIIEVPEDHRKIMLQILTQDTKEVPYYKFLCGL